MDGLRFACQPGCVKCCEVEGLVYLTEDDVRRAAKFLRMTPLEFEAKYTIRTKYLIRLKKTSATPCDFLENGGCRIHPAKPTQCRLFPFWPEIVESRSEWNKTAKWCPGMNQGPLVQIGSALETADEMRTAYPRLYRTAG
jgi:Fe-S-cluster containining protein